MPFLENLKSLWKSGEITLDQYREQVENSFVSEKTVDAKGNVIATDPHTIIKQVADKKELKEIIDQEQNYELERLHRQKRKWDGEMSQIVDGDGIPVGKMSMAEAMSHNAKLRPKVKKILKLDSLTNKFFSTKPGEYEKFEKYKKAKVYRAPESMEDALTNRQVGFDIPKEAIPHTQENKAVDLAADAIEKQKARHKEKWEQPELPFEEFIKQRADARWREEIKHKGLNALMKKVRNNDY